MGSLTSALRLIVPVTAVLATGSVAFGQQPTPQPSPTPEPIEPGRPPNLVLGAGETIKYEVVKRGDQCFQLAILLKTVPGNPPGWISTIMYEREIPCSLMPEPQPVTQTTPEPNPPPPPPPPPPPSQPISQTPPHEDPPPPPPPPPPPEGNWPPGVDKITVGPNGTTFEHHTDGSTVIKGPDGKVVGLIPVPLQQPTEPPKQAHKTINIPFGEDEPQTPPPPHKTINIPFGEDKPQTPPVGKVETGKIDTPPNETKTTSTPVNRNEQSVIDAMKAHTVPGHTDVTPGPGPKPGLVTPQEKKTTTLTEPKTVTRTEPKTTTRRTAKTITHVEPRRTATRYANHGPATARVTPRAVPNMRFNTVRPAAFTHAAPRMAAPRMAAPRMGGFRGLSRDSGPAGDSAPAPQQPEQQSTEQPK